MHPFFAPLSAHEATLLLTLLTVGGSEQLDCLAHLTPEVRDRLEAKAQALDAIPSDRRMQLMVLELKNLLASSGQRGVERVDPSWILHHLRGETPRVVASILLGLPRPLQRSVYQRLPNAIKTQLPRKDELRRTPTEVTHTVRQRFALRFHPMPMPGPAPQRFADCIYLVRRELHGVVRSLGLIELGQAFVAVGKVALAELCRRLPRPQAEELVHAVKVASQVDLPDLNQAQWFLSRIVGNFENTEEFLQKSGLWRLAKAARLEAPDWRQAMAQRLPRRAAQQWLGFIDRAAEVPSLDQTALERLQDAILVRFVVLARRQRLSSAWATASLAYFDPAAAQDALQSAEAAPEFDGA